MKGNLFLNTPSHHYAFHLSHLLILGSFIFYSIGLLFDFYSTMKAFFIYGNEFYSIEINQIVSWFLQKNLIPIHVFVIYIVLGILTIYVICKHKNKLFTIIYFSILLIVFGIIHFTGGMMWYLYGWI